jgi:GntR family transcriptional regulator/MocR family aminotransferase
MPRSRSAFGTDLHLELTGSRVRLGLEHALRGAIRHGRLLPGARLPSSRQLADDLGLARNTVADVYGQLVAEGWLTSRHGAGTWVAEHRAPTPAARPRTAGAVGRPARYDLRPGLPDLSAFPRSAWLAAARRAVNAAPYDSLGYGDPLGLPPLRAAIAEYLGRVRGVLTSTDRIVICPGFTQALALLCQVLHERGARRLVTEAYGHALHRGVVERHGLGSTAVDVDADGAVVAQFGAADAVLLTPAHQFPLGVPLAAARRRSAVDWAIDRGGIIIEDDYDGEFRYDRSAVAAMQALAPEHVVYAGTASKSLAPGVRLCWLVLPAALVDPVVEARRATGALPGSIDQLTMAQFITSGGYDRHIRRVRLAYRRRRDRLAAVVGEASPHTRVTGIAAGLQALLELPPDHDEDTVVTRAAEHGLAIDGLRSYTAAGHRHRAALVIGYAKPPEHRYSTALARLRTVLVGLGPAD